MLKYLLLSVLLALGACGDDTTLPNRLARVEGRMLATEERLRTLENPVVVEAPRSSTIAKPELGTCGFGSKTLWIGGAKDCFSCWLQEDGSFGGTRFSSCWRSHFDCVGGRAVFVSHLGDVAEVMSVVTRSGVTRVEGKDGTGYDLHNTEAECLLGLHDSAVSRVEAVALGLPATESSALVVPATPKVSPKHTERHRHSTLQCCDGSYSPSCTYNHRGCCSRHGGVCE